MGQDSDANLYEIVYQSLSDVEFQISDLNELMVISKASNVKINITGCLVYHNRTFIQVIEGHLEDVKTLYGKIRLDKRHSKVQTVWEGKIKQRGFNGWSMSLMNLNDSRLTEIFSDFLDNDNLAYDVEGIVTTSKSLLMEMKDKI